VTDHKALEEIRRKPYFENNRINRWIESIQEFDFEVRYSKGEDLMVPDALSGLHENEDCNRNNVINKGKKGLREKIIQGKWNKHVENIECREDSRDS
jgi:hypothetical protein